MSRIAKYPVDLPPNVRVILNNEMLQVTGSLGSLEVMLPAEVNVHHENNQLKIFSIGSSKKSKALSGTMRAIVSNLVIGVTKGFEKRLNLVGVGYKAQAQGDNLILSLGFSHPIMHRMPQGIKVETPTQAEVIIKGIDRQLVGQVASEIRAYRPPEPYKGKGIRYADETIVIKETKKK